MTDEEREPTDPAQRELYWRLMRERYGDLRKLEKERSTTDYRRKTQ